VAVGCGPLPTGAAAPTKPRVVVMTDIGGDPDDEQSIVRFLLYSCDFEVEGLCTGLGHDRDHQTRPDLLHKAVDAYGQVLPDLRLHRPDFPAPEQLKCLIKDGFNGDPHTVGPGRDSEASDWIIRVLDQPDPRPVWFCIWGGPRELAQAIWKVQTTRSAPGLAAFKRKIRVYSIADQDRTALWVKTNHPDVFWILSDGQFRGIWRGGDPASVSPEWLEGHVRTGHGPLGAVYPPKAAGKVGVKEGDTPSFLYLVPNGLSDPAHPEWGNWGGRFQRRGPGQQFVSVPDLCDGKPDMLYPVRRWRSAYQNEFQARMDWCVKPVTQANHAPVAVLNGDPTQRVLEIETSPGATLRLSAAGSSDSDGHSLSFRWWTYIEAGTYPAAPTIQGARDQVATVTIPTDASGHSIHVILEVTDTGQPPLVAYRRAILKVAGQPTPKPRSLQGGEPNPAKPAPLQPASASPHANTAAERQRVEAQVDAAAAIRYLLQHQKPNGAFGPAGHTHTDLAWNYPAVHALTLLRQPVPRPEDCFRNGTNALYKQPGSHNANWAWDIYQRAHLAAVLHRHGQDGLGLSGTWTVRFQDRQGDYYFRITNALLRQRVAPFCDIPTLAYWVEAIRVSGGRIANPDTVRQFLLARQLPNGAFVDAYRSEHVTAADAHAVATAQAVFALRALGDEVPNARAVVAWLQSCQAESGGFRWHPDNPAPSNQPDVWYTWAAVRALAMLGAKPRDPAACLTWLNSLQNPDGGFGDRPGWNSRLYSTYYAVHALHALTGDARTAITRKTVSAWRRVIPEGRYSIFQAYLKSPRGGPEMVETARSLRLNLLAIKDNSPGAPQVPVTVARAYAQEKRYPLEIVSCPEQYAHRLRWRGGHPAHHVANYIIPPDLSAQARAQLAAADAAGRQGLPWVEYGARVIGPIVRLGSLFYPELDYEMMNAYMVYDDGLEGGPGYTALVGALGWPVWDWVRMFPYRERWAGRLPMVADGDAHGDIVKWREPLDRQRMLYLARHHDLASFLEACRAGRTVCVIRTGPNKDELALYGDPAVVDYVKRHQPDWQWWP